MFTFRHQDDGLVHLIVPDFRHTHGNTAGMLVAFDGLPVCRGFYGVDLMKVRTSPWNTQRPDDACPGCFGTP